MIKNLIICSVFLLFSFCYVQFAFAQEITETPEPTPSQAETVNIPKEEAPAKKAEKKLSPVDALFLRMTTVNEGLEDYSSDLSLKAKVKYSFLELPLDLNGDYYFKAPDKYKMKINKAPQFLAKYPQVFGWSLPDPKEFTVKIFDEDGKADGNYRLRMIPKRGRGDLLKVEMWVNKKSALFNKQVYTYREGGEIIVTNTYRTVEGFKLFDTVNATIRFPKVNVNAVVDAVYGQYHINQGLSDDIFDDVKKK